MNKTLSSIALAGLLVIGSVGLAAPAHAADACTATAWASSNGITGKTANCGTTAKVQVKIMKNVKGKMVTVLGNQGSVSKANLASGTFVGAWFRSSLGTSGWGGWTFVTPTRG